MTSIRTRHRWVFALAILGSLAVVAAQSPDTSNWGFKTLDAQAAVKRYEAQLARINDRRDRQLAVVKSQHDEEAAQLRKKLIEDLTAAQKKAMDLGNLDEAVKIRDALKALPEDGAGAADPVEEAPVANDPARRYAGRWSKEAGGHYELRPDGTGIREDNGRTPFKWAANEHGQVFLIFESGYVIPLQVAEGGKTAAVFQGANLRSNDAPQAETLRKLEP